MMIKDVSFCRRPLPFPRRRWLTLCWLTLSLQALWMVPILADAKGSRLPTRLGEGLETELDQIFQEAYPADGPGAAVLVTQGGQILLRQSYGMADLELGVVLEPDMVFRVGSMTKQFTAVGIMMLVEEGKLSLADDFTLYLPSYPTPRLRSEDLEEPDAVDSPGHQGPTAAGGTEPDEVRKVTIEHLLTHTSGIPSYTSIPEVLQKLYEPLTLEELIAIFKNRPLEFEPGSQWSYNNSGYVLLGAIIESVSGQTYAEFIRERMFEPLAMKNSHYGEHGRIIPRRVSGYHRGDDCWVNAPYISMTIPHAAGSLLSTVDDLALWQTGLESGKLLSSEALERLWTPFKLTDGSDSGYGLGWFLGRLGDSPVIQHSGSIHGFGSMGIHLPKQQALVVVLTNNPHGKSRAPVLAQRVASLLAGEDDLLPSEVSRDVLDPYVGVYQIDSEKDWVVSFEQDSTEVDILYFQETGGVRQRILFTSETEFFRERTLTRGRFLIEDGKVRGMELKEWSRPEKFFPRTAKPLPGGARSVEVDPTIYDAYVGKYEIFPDFILTVRRDGDRLITQATGQPELEIFPASETEFFNEQINGRIVFIRDPAGGEVKKLTMHMGPRALTAKRIE